MRPLPWLPPWWGLLLLCYGVFSWGPVLAMAAVLVWAPDGIGVGMEGPLLTVLGGVVLGTVAVVVLLALTPALGWDAGVAKVASYPVAALAALAPLGLLLVVAGVPAMLGAVAASLGGLTPGARPQPPGPRRAGYVGLVAIAATLVIDLVVLAQLVGELAA